MWLNYDETYAVSEDGLVMNRKTGLILKPNSDRYGYLRVSLHHKEITHIHRMVAQMFCPKIDLLKLEVDHINRNREDNRAINLRWCDRTANERNKKASHIYVNQNGYRVCFVSNKIRIYDKYFKTLEEATVARDAFKECVKFKELSPTA
jgi:hypothetical protein